MRDKTILALVELAFSRVREQKLGKEASGVRLIIQKDIFPVFLPISLFFLAHSNINSAILWFLLDIKHPKST